MKIEDVIKSIAPMDNSKKIILNIMYTQNIVAEKFNDILKQYDISGEQYNVLRILRGQKGNPANMCVIQERMLAKTSNTTRLVDKLLLKELSSTAMNWLSAGCSIYTSTGYWRFPIPFFNGGIWPRKQLKMSL